MGIPAHSKAEPRGAAALLLKRERRYGAAQDGRKRPAFGPAGLTPPYPTGCAGVAPSGRWRVRTAVRAVID